ncbi:hypothetical protein Nos7524_1647 [Nostoc sp. PCC 7524]|nr:hypothetical protein Nos7524_1647 [Nostoc sp. PCC 7524]
MKRRDILNTTAIATATTALVSCTRTATSPSS